MQKGIRSNIRLSLSLLAATLCVAPAAAHAQSWNPTASDSHDNTAAGTNALLNVTGFNNTAIGADALKSNTAGDYNTAGGAFALTSNTTGNYNTASGVQALYSNTTGSYNTVSGVQALYSNTTGHSNIANGVSALYFNTTGKSNTASGRSALYSNATGSNNTAVGFQALQANRGGSNNVAIGSGALLNLKGGNNIGLGTNAGMNVTTGTNNIYIGHRGPAGSESKVTRIGQAQTKVFIAGIARAPMAGATVVVRSNGRLGVVASSARYKQDIRPLEDTADKLARLRPVSYRYKAQPEATHYGLIAEEVEAVMPELVVRDNRDRPESIQYRELIPLLLQQVNRQRTLIARQRDRLDRQEAKLMQEEAELATLRRTLATRLAALDGGK